MYIGLHLKYPLLLSDFNPLNAELNPIRHLLALVGARHIVHVSRIRVNETSIHWEQSCAMGTDGQTRTVTLRNFVKHLKINLHLLHSGMRKKK